MKCANIHPKARETLRTFPEDVRGKIGKAIHMLQMGHRLIVPLSKSMASVAPGVSEIRVRGADGIYRAFYVVESDTEVMIFHAFVKKTQKAPKLEIELGRKRLKELRNG